MNHDHTIKVLIVDDSAMVRAMLTQVLSGEPDITVVGGAKDPIEARELIIACRPTVIVLDVEMPRMDGLTFLKKLRVHYPVPVLICSGVTPANGRIALEAIECGAIDVIAKPAAGGSAALRRLGEELAEKIRAAAIAGQPPPPIPISAAAKPTSFRAAGVDPNRTLVAIGASTGGTEALRALLKVVPPDFPPTAIVLHMPAGFTKSFADRLDQESPLAITEAVDGDVLTPGRAVLARGGLQMSVRSVGGRWMIAYGDDQPVNRHCPSVDVLFDSVARNVGAKAVGVILTGMGGDGAQGLLNMRGAGAITIGQNAESCVVYGMPKVAADIGAVQRTGAPHEIPGLALQLLRQRVGRTSAGALQP